MKQMRHLITSTNTLTNQTAQTQQQQIGGGGSHHGLEKQHLIMPLQTQTQTKNTALRPLSIIVDETEIDVLSQNNTAAAHSAQSQAKTALTSSLSPGRRFTYPPSNSNNSNNVLPPILQQQSKLSRMLSSPSSSRSLFQELDKRRAFKPTNKKQNNQQHNSSTNTNTTNSNDHTTTTTNTTTAAEIQLSSNTFHRVSLSFNAALLSPYLQHHPQSYDLSQPLTLVLYQIDPHSVSMILVGFIEMNAADGTPCTADTDITIWQCANSITALCLTIHQAQQMIGSSFFTLSSLLSSSSSTLLLPISHSSSLLQQQALDADAAQLSITMKHIQSFHTVYDRELLAAYAHECHLLKSFFPTK